MPTNIRELREQRMTLVTRGRELTDRAGTENRDLNAEENQEFQRIYGVEGDPNATGISAEQRTARQGELGLLEQRIEREERQIEAERRSAEDALRIREQGGGSGGGSGAPANASEALAAIRTWESERGAAFRTFLGDQSRNGGYRFEHRDISALSEDEQRALQGDSDVLGGYTVRPEEFIARLIQAVDDAVYIRRNATVFPVTDADSLGVPSLDADPDDGDWTVELGTGNEDSAMRFGKRELRPHPVAKRIKVSKTLLRRSALPIEGIVQQRLAFKFGVTEEKAFLTGSGAGQPLGAFTASPDGVPTSRDISTGNTTTSITFDGLIEAKYFTKAQYWPRLRWGFHRDAIKQISKLKDGDGQYIWQPSVRDGQPDRLLSFPMDVSEFIPNTFTTGLYVGILADWSWYWIADSLAMELERLVELYSETNQVGFILRKETDGMPVLAEAFTRVKLA
jgi:HK97 family phage major capsid protein